MSVLPNILVKIKKLQALSKSSNENESAAAFKMIEQLIIKYQITGADLQSIEDKKPLYSDNEKLFSTIGIVGYKQQLALAVGSHLECQIVQEELVPLEGPHQFDYFVYGDPVDADNVKFVFKAFVEKIEEFLRIKCIDKDSIYISSYAEGLVEAIKSNIYWEGFDLPNAKQPSRAPQELLINNGSSNLSKPKVEKDKPANQSVDVNSQSNIQDVVAYFKGIADGKHFSLTKILELASTYEIKNKFSVSETEELQIISPDITVPSDAEPIA